MRDTRWRVYLALLPVLLAALAGGGLAAAFAAPSPARAHFESAPWSWHVDVYSFDDSDCLHRVDPVTLVLYRNTNADLIFHHFSHHGWGWAAFGNQNFWDHGCAGSGDSRQAADDCSLCDRYHVRWHPGGADDESWGPYVLATPHREQWIWFCDGGLGSHATDSYWDAKRVIGERWHQWQWDPPSGHRFAGHEMWDNKEPRRQCNETEVANDGWVDFVRIP